MGVVEEDLEGGGAGGAGVRDLGGEGFGELVEDAVNRLRDGEGVAVVEGDGHALETGVGVAGAHGEEPGGGGAGEGGFLDDGRGVVDEEVVGFEGDGVALGGEAGRDLAHGEAGEMVAGAEEATVELGEAVGGVHREVLPGGVGFVTHAEGDDEVVAVEVFDAPVHELGGGLGDDGAAEEGGGGAAFGVFVAAGGVDD